MNSAKKNAKFCGIGLEIGGGGEMGDVRHFERRGTLPYKIVDPHPKNVYRAYLCVVKSLECWTACIPQRGEGHGGQEVAWRSVKFRELHFGFLTRSEPYLFVLYVSSVKTWGRLVAGRQGLCNDGVAAFKLLITMPDWRKTLAQTSRARSPRPSQEEGLNGGSR